MPKRWFDELEETLQELELPGSSSVIIQNQYQMRIDSTYPHCSQHAEVKQSYWMVNIRDGRKGQRSCHCIVVISPFSAYA